MIKIVKRSQTNATSMLKQMRVEAGDVAWFGREGRGDLAGTKPSVLLPLLHWPGMVFHTSNPSA